MLYIDAIDVIKVSVFQMLESNLFHSIMARRKNEFLKTDASH